MHHTGIDRQKDVPIDLMIECIKSHNLDIEYVCTIHSCETNRFDVYAITNSAQILRSSEVE